MERCTRGTPPRHSSKVGAVCGKAARTVLCGGRSAMVVPTATADSWNRVRYMILAMFCPECRAEYRPGFTRCSDCDVDLVHEIPEEGTRVRKRDSATTLPTFINIHREGGGTVQWWTSYRRQTGGWPWFSIIIHFMNWVVILIGGGFLIWWTVDHHLSRWQFLGIFLLASLPYTILENWAKRKVKLSNLRERAQCNR
jgi:hypothetical protein